MTPTIALAAGVLVLFTTLSLTFFVIGRRRRTPDRSMRDLGTVSQQWLIVHRSESL